MNESVLKARVYNNAEKTAVFFIAALGATLLGGLSALLSGALQGYAAVGVKGFIPPVIATSLIWGGIYFLAGLSLYTVIIKTPFSRLDLTVKNWSVGLWFVWFALSLALPFFVFNGMTPVAFIICTLINGVITSLAALNYKINVLSSLLLLPALAFSMLACYAIIYNLVY